MQWNWLAPWAGLGSGGSIAGVAGRDPSRRLSPPPGPLRPLLVLSAGHRAAAVSLWLKESLGCRAVHCVQPGAGSALARLVRGGRLEAELDLVVTPDRGRTSEAANVVRVLGAPHRVGPPNLHNAAEQWAERLDHLPRPRVALLVGGRPSGTDMEPSRAHALGRSLASLVSGLGGSVLATTSRRTGREAGEALAAGLSHVMHLLYRWGEPGENPYLGFLAIADAVVVTADSAAMLSEACATSGAVFAACPDLASGAQRRFLRKMMEAGQVRPLGQELSPWPRTPLDEAGRVASEVRRRIALPAPRG